MDNLEKGNRSDEDLESPEEEEVDPRIQGELEKLNQSTDDINRCETELEDARQNFRSVLVEATVKLEELVKKIGKAVEDSKPYWEARRVARQAQLEAQRATQDFQRATEVLRAAKETIALAEQRLLEEDKRQFDSAWQEMLNHATQRQLKKNVDDLQARLTLAKGEYKTALHNLEMISDEIHERRRSSAMGPRGRGVGAEGDSNSGDDIANFKMESDGISMTSESFEDDHCGIAMSEDDSETQSTCSLSSGNASPVDLLCPFPPSSPSPSSSSSPSPSPSSRPSSLDLPSPISLSDFGLISPVLGPRSECSGASSPDCDLERGDRAEGAESELDNVLNNNTTNHKKSLGLESRFGRLSLKRPKMDSTKKTEHDRFSLARIPAPTLVLFNGV
ncbi:SH3 domain-binding protein 5b isoform X2 [Conger conger]|uniref:SH3 domain-binding protein 5b isoform X2 n=1 Tax=Conger conger TaxID=82655 RepID=UPI002A5AE3B3|nr:SH3 domain-binding protein 5b isoform X2 [Conger conger]